MVPSSSIDVMQIIIVFIAIIISFLLIISGTLFYLRKKKPGVVALEAIKIHEFISLCISFFYFITVVVTLIVLIYQNKIFSMQTRYALQSVEGSIYSNITTQSLAEDEIFINHPELRPYFYAGKELEANDPLKHQVHAAAEYILDFFDALESQLKKYPSLWIHEKREWEANIVDQCAWSPVLCHLFGRQPELVQRRTFRLENRRRSEAAAGLHRPILAKGEALGAGFSRDGTAGGACAHRGTLPWASQTGRWEEDGKIDRTARFNEAGRG